EVPLAPGLLGAGVVDGGELAPIDLVVEDDGVVGDGRADDAEHLGPVGQAPPPVDGALRQAGMGGANAFVNEFDLTPGDAARLVHAVEDDLAAPVPRRLEVGPTVRALQCVPQDTDHKRIRHDTSTPRRRSSSRPLRPRVAAGQLRTTRAAESTAHGMDETTRSR